jgi:hypothetical protein
MGGQERFEDHFIQNTLKHQQNTMTKEKPPKVGDLVKSKLGIHINGLTTWRILEVNIGLSGRKSFFCEAAHDTKFSSGFDKIKRDFSENQIELA